MKQWQSNGYEHPGTVTSTGGRPLSADERFLLSHTYGISRGKVVNVDEAQSLAKFIKRVFVTCVMYIRRTYFFLSKFNSKDVSHEEKLPRNFKDFDGLLGKILINLEETENVFLNQAKAVVDRDLTLINWRFRLKELQRMLKERKRDFERIDQTVQCILRLNTYIDNILSKLEKELPQPSLIENAFKYSPARMTMYDAMLKININQRDMLQQLSNTFLSINETNECSPSDPVDQYTRILSLHTEILRTIELRTGLAEEQMTTVKTLRQYLSAGKKPMACEYFCWFNG